MTAFLKQRWFLLALLAGVVLCGASPELGRRLFGWLPARVVVGVALFLVAVSLDGRDLGRALAQPGAALWGLVVSFAVVPPLALLAGLVLPPDLRIGLLLVAASPCTLASAVIWTRRAGGSDATALLVVVLTNGVGWLITPLWLTLFGGASLDAGPMMLELLLVLVLPVAAGQLLRRAGPAARLADRGKSLLGVLSQLLVLGVLLRGIADALLRLGDQLSPAALGPLMLAAALSLGVHLAALLIAGVGAGWLGFERPARIAVAFAGSQKSIPVAILLFERYLQADYPLALVPVVCFHIGQLVVDTFIADRLRTQGKVDTPDGTAGG